MARNIVGSHSANFFPVCYTLNIGAMTEEMVPFIMPIDFTIHRMVDNYKGVSRDAMKILSCSPRHVEQHLLGILGEASRAVITSTTVVEIVECFGKFRRNIIQRVQSELVSLGLYLFKVKTRRPQLFDEEEETIATHVSNMQTRVMKKPSTKDHGISNRKKERKTGIRRKTNKKRKLRAAEPPMPHPMRSTVEEIGGEDVKWINNKVITKTDVDPYQNRLYLPNEIEEVLTAAEKEHLNIKGNELDVVVVDHNCMHYEMTLRFWSSVERYVLYTNWIKYSEDNKIEGDVHAVDIWTFRKSSHESNKGEDQDGKDILCFALKFREAEVL